MSFVQRFCCRHGGAYIIYSISRKYTSQYKNGWAIVYGADGAVRRQSGVNIFATMKKGFPCVRYMTKNRIYVHCIPTIKMISSFISGKHAVTGTIIKIYKAFILP